jgi:hypothetical protein
VLAGGWVPKANLSFTTSVLLGVNVAPAQLLPLLGAVACTENDVDPGGVAEEVVIVNVEALFTVPELVSVKEEGLIV